MSRDLSATIQTGMAEPITEPVYLVECLLPEPLYWATSEAKTWDSKTWLPVGLVVGQIKETTARLKIRNDDNSGGSLMLNNALRDTEFRIYLWYNGDAKEIWRGYGGGADLAAMDCTIDLHSTKAQSTKAPRRKIAGPLFTNLPRAGTVLRWGDDEIRIEN